MRLDQKRLVEGITKNSEHAGMDENVWVENSDDYNL